MTAQCTASSGGLTCIRPAGHGDLHVDPKYARKEHCNIWVLEALGADEEEGRMPMSGYRMLTDIVRPDGVDGLP
jgi:hypothetical protein